MKDRSPWILASFSSMHPIYLIPIFSGPIGTLFGACTHCPHNLIWIIWHTKAHGSCWRGGGGVTRLGNVRPGDRNLKHASLNPTRGGGGARFFIWEIDTVYIGEICTAHVVLKTLKNSWSQGDSEGFSESEELSVSYFDTFLSGCSSSKYPFNVIKRPPITQPRIWSHSPDWLHFMGNPRPHSSLLSTRIWPTWYLCPFLSLHVRPGICRSGHKKVCLSGLNS